MANLKTQIIRLVLDTATNNHIETVVGNRFEIIDASSSAASVTAKFAGAGVNNIEPLIFQDGYGLVTPEHFDATYLSWGSQPGEWVDVMVVAQDVPPTEFNYFRQGRVSISGTTSVTGTVTAKVRSGDTIAYGAVSVGASATQIVAASTSRGQITIRNNHASNILYLGDVNVTTGAGLPLRPGEVYTNNTGAAIYGIASGAGTDVRYLAEAV
jgi:hypothetical protein